MSQNFDHTSQIYRRIIDETITGACRLQSEAVLRELRQKWLAKLAERIQEMPAKRVEADLQRISEANRTASRQVKQVKKEVPDMLDTGLAAPIPQLQPVVGAGVWDTALTYASFNESTAAGGAATTTTAAKMPAPELHQAPRKLPPEQGADTTTTAVGGAGSAVSGANGSGAIGGGASGIGTSGVGEGVSEGGGEEEDDGWGEWEDPAALEAKPKAPAAPVAVEVVEVVEEVDPSIPQDADFAAKLRTQYGGGAYGDGEDPDEVNSDLDEVKTLSDEEPVAHDVIIGQCEELVRPGARKAQMQGTWEIRVKNGIASVNGQEFMFDTLEATLEF
ncbi:hypothetical protein GNI_176080 [Gregarina niphandrodes]|uniref:Transcription factor IIA, alpha/beta subunit n=1 Tax=Gregarina niphandrodes TaxID=110365 RepID=A0A023AX87_GRENI|nr:hypothetical protein GNI_176080 [Gregarina niphandrodes]EZG43346.1 hypothetical protein GNI_176080 [Gregarina niphandrodes]|eukprot:XP_011133395.1 hypothetical protein GNI_176080 [Gregarina niphandrodes]